VLLDAMDSYLKAAEKDREAQSKEREARALDREAEASARVEHERERRSLAERDASHMAAQRRQGWIMVGVTVAIMISTVFYMIAAWKQAEQPSIQLTAPVVAPK
jgi:cytochrome c-type biogenesis protein CcmH/NrfG